MQRFLLPLFVSLWVMAATENAKAQTSYVAVRPRERQAQVTISRALEKTASWDFREISLDEFKRGLEAELRVPVVLDQRRLEEAGIATSARYSAQFQGMSCRAALSHFLHRFSLAWTIVDEAILITTEEDAENRLETRVYPVGDLIRDGYKPNQIDFTELIQIITTNCAKPKPGWPDDGGLGTISFSYLNKSLTITQAHEVHEQIESLLQSLRDAKRRRGLPTLSTKRAKSSEHRR